MRYSRGVLVAALGDAFTGNPEGYPVFPVPLLVIAGRVYPADYPFRHLSGVGGVRETSDVLR